MNTKTIINFKKLNRAVIEKEINRKKIKLSGYPYYARIDPSSNICNLRCVFCPVGDKNHGRPSKYMSFRQFSKVLSQIGIYLYHIDLFNWGEPLLNKEIYKMVSLAKRYRISCRVTTNFNYFSASQAEEIIKSGLDYLELSIDGLTQKSYSRYRVRGNLNRVIENIKILIDKKRVMNSKKPFITWRFLVFRHNEDEIEKVCNTAEDLGIDMVKFASAFIYDVEKNYDLWVPINKKYSKYSKDKDGNIIYKSNKKFCTSPWLTVVINSNGSVFPCCGNIPEKDNLGNIFQTPFKDIWNSEKYQEVRKFISTKKVSGNNALCCCNCFDISDSKIVFRSHPKDGTSCPGN